MIMVIVLELLPDCVRFLIIYIMKEIFYHIQWLLKHCNIVTRIVNNFPQTGRSWTTTNDVTMQNSAFELKESQTSARNLSLNHVMSRRFVRKVGNEDCKE